MLRNEAVSYRSTASLLRNLQISLDISDYTSRLATREATNVDHEKQSCHTLDINLMSKRFIVRQGASTESFRGLVNESQRFRIWQPDNSSIWKPTRIDDIVI